MVGPLATYAEPHCYDLCETHSTRLTAPLGWEVVRHGVDSAGPAQRGVDDLEALADVVREPGRATRSGAAPETGRRGHLRALPTPL